MHRFGTHLSLVVLATFALAIVSAVAVPVVALGGATGWASGALLGAGAAEVLRRPCGVLVGALVDQDVR